MRNQLKTSSSFSLVVFAACLLSVGSASAAIVVSLFDDESDLVNTGGTLVSACHFQHPTTSGDPDPLVVNGISHPVNTANGAGLTINTFFEGDFRNGGSGLVQDGSDIVQVLLSGIAGASAITMSVSGLSIGQEYLFQAYWEDNDDPAAVLETTIEGETLGGITSLSSKPGAPGGNLISYQFTAGDDTLNAAFDRTDANTNNWLSGYSLQTAPIPEPATLSLLGIAAAGLMLAKRRRG